MSSTLDRQYLHTIAEEPLSDVQRIPRNIYEIWTPGLYSSYDTAQMLSPKLARTLSDSGRDSIDSSELSESDELPPNTKRYTRALTIYQIEKAKAGNQRFRSLPPMNSRYSFTTSTKVYINDDGSADEVRSEPNSTVLKIFIPPVYQPE
jgi:hypothetical protein